MSARPWTCQRVTGGAKCGHVNPSRRYRNCQACGKPRPDTKPPAHMSALELPMAYYVEINGGPNCGICGKPPAPGEKFHRDHEHKGVGFPRGVLCFPCNSALRPYMDLAWVEAAAAYLRRAEERRPS